MESQAQEYIKVIQQAIKKQDHKTIFQYSILLLKESKEDIDYIQLNALSGIKIGAYKDIEHLFKQPVDSQLLKIYSYYLYAKGQYSNVIKLIEMNKMNEPILLSQAYYKTLNNKKSAQILIKLLSDKNLSEDDKQSCLVNLLATSPNPLLHERAKQLIQINKNTCKQVLYNYSLMEHNMNSGKQQQYLDKFKAMLVKQDTVDIANEDVFRNYLHQLRKEKYAYEMMEVQDQNLRGVIACNIAKQHNQALKIIDDCLNQSKISKTQLQILKLNKCQLIARKGKISEAAKLLKQVESLEEQPNKLYQNQQFVKTKYFIFKKNKQFQQIDKLLANPNINVTLRLNLYIDHNSSNKQLLISELKNHKQYKKYIFSILLSNPIYLKNQTAYLEQIIKQSDDNKILATLLELYQTNKDFQHQYKILAKMLENNSKDQIAKLKMSRILLEKGSIKESEQMVRGLQTPQQITDISYLQYIEKNIHISIKKQEPIEEGYKHQTKKKIKKKRKLRLPKGVQFVKDFKGDIQRWLPKWQRKGYKKRGKKGNTKTQGLATIGKQQTKNTFTTGASTSGKQVTRQAIKKKR